MLLKVSRIIRETPDTVIIRLGLEDEKFDFIPGQYVILEQEIDGKKIKRAYSICSSPGKKYIEIAVKEMPKGKMSTFINRYLKVGAEFKVIGPLGNFTLDKSSKKITLICAGSGITPFMSFMRYIKDKKINIDVILLFSNKTPKNIIFRKELNELNKEKKFNIIITITRVDWNGPTGRININMIKDLNGFFYICGPPLFVKDMYNMLLKANVSKDKIKREMFG